MARHPRVLLCPHTAAPSTLAPTPRPATTQTPKRGTTNATAGTSSRPTISMAPGLVALYVPLDSLKWLSWSHHPATCPPSRPDPGRLHGPCDSVDWATSTLPILPAPGPGQQEGSATGSALGPARPWNPPLRRCVCLLPFLLLVTGHDLCPCPLWPPCLLALKEPCTPKSPPTGPRQPLRLLAYMPATARSHHASPCIFLPEPQEQGTQVPGPRWQKCMAAAAASSTLSGQAQPHLWAPPTACLQKLPSPSQARSSPSTVADGWPSSAPGAPVLP